MGLNLGVNSTHYNYKCNTDSLFRKSKKFCAYASWKSRDDINVMIF